MTRAQMLSRIANELGEDVEDMLARAIFDGVSPGICRECGSIEDCCEPDATENWCSECGANAVIAATELLA